jgi:hypothetical protein
MPGESPFANDWRDCLRAHYTYTVRAEDRVTERTLVDVLQEVGFSENEVKEMRVLATMRVEDMGEGFVPDLNILEDRQAVIDEESFMIAVPEIVALQQETASKPTLPSGNDDLFESSGEMYLPDEALAALSEDDLLAGDIDEVVEAVDDVEDSLSHVADSPVQLSLF